MLNSTTIDNVRTLVTEIQISTTICKFRNLQQNLITLLIATTSSNKGFPPSIGREWISSEGSLKKLQTKLEIIELFQFIKLFCVSAKNCKNIFQDNSKSFVVFQPNFDVC